MIKSSFIHRTIICIFLGTTVPFSAITVDINSGNPASPFPQFQPYVNPTDTLYNLATHNPVGVPHAEMEKSIREAYQIMMNRAEKTGESLEGVDYIRYLSNPQCSEGDGYGLLGAAAMADKTTFDGMWLYIHDFCMNRVIRYLDCGENSADYAYSQLPGWTGVGANSAADGDFDIALALLQAYKQWGEFMGIDDACGNPISYKQAAIDFLKALTDTLTHPESGNLLSGDIGLDGYVKSGDSWGELSGWSADMSNTGLSKRAEQPGPYQQYFDYFAPAYFHQFADFLAGEDSAAYAWNIYQFRRAAASSDWLMGQLYNADPKNIPICGNVTISGTTPSFQFTGMMGEDFRLGWRTILGRLWTGNPNSSWNPETHQVDPGVSNSYEEDMGKRYAGFLWDARQEPWGNECLQTPGVSPIAIWGPSTVASTLGMTGNNDDSYFFLNWMHGAGSPSAVVAQNFNLMAEMYRQCEIEFDVDEPGDGYLTAVPFYYHGWFRLLGMLVLSGNYTAPSQINTSANIKVYCDVDKTSARKDEEITYSISYRNYGAAAVEGVTISDKLPAGLTFVTTTGNGHYNEASHTVSWNIGNVPGFTSESGIAPTVGEVTVTVRVDDNTRRQCRNQVSISCTNSSGWETNEYPNLVSPIMKRNYIDILDKPLMDEDNVYFLPELHGGRPGVYFSFSESGESPYAMQTFRIQMFNDAQEPYIDFGNYRISYFLNEEKFNCLADVDSCTSGWSYTRMITEGVDNDNLIFRHENIVSGSDKHGAWNQRIVIQCGNPEDTGYISTLGTTFWHLDSFRGIKLRIHRGVSSPLRIVWSINNTLWEDVQWNDDWSWNSGIDAEDLGDYFPVTPDFTDPTPDNSGVTVDRLHPKQCAVAEKTVDNILIEEWDGYTWRKVFGNAPQATVAVQPQVVMQKNKLSITAVTPSRIRFNLPSDGKVRLQMLDLKGRVTATLIDGFRKAGDHQVKWSDGRISGSQVCMVRLQAEEGRVVQRMLLLK